MLLVFDSHPVQYRVPIWQNIAHVNENRFHVVYGSICSVRGYKDKGFGKVFSWDEPLLKGYEYTVLNSERGEDPLSGWRSLSGKGVGEIIKRYKPKAILLTGFNYQYDLAAFWYAISNRIPVWLRCETQDYAFSRPRIKFLFRWVIYFLLYKGISKFFFIGELNRRHYLVHGVPESKLVSAKYCTVDRFSAFSSLRKNALRDTQRKVAGIKKDNYVIGFSGKFILKKDPEILFSMLEFLPANLLTRIHLYFLGSGPLEERLKELATSANYKYGVKTYFAGFVNQSELAPNYLAMDVLVLPSRRMGETWGLVANEAMQAGCSVVVSDAVGCSADFKSWPQFRVFPEGSAEKLADCLIELSEFERNFEWANAALINYSIDAVSNAFRVEMQKLGS